jgi:hypothetical protein
MSPLTINDLASGDIDFVFKPLDGSSVADADADAESAGGDGADDQGQAGGTDPAAVAQSTLVTLTELGPDWVPEPRSDDETDYRSIDGCGPHADLIDNDGHLAEAESPDYTSGNTSVIHDVRVYPDEATALEVIVAWGEQLALDCIVAGSEQQAAESFASGEFDGWEEVKFDLQAFQDLDGEPRFTHLVLNNVLVDANGDEFLVVNDMYFIQVGRLVSGVLVTTPGSTWSDTPALLDIVVERMAASKEALQG